jgi:hypothetical protein
LSAIGRSRSTYGAGVEGSAAGGDCGAGGSAAASGSIAGRSWRFGRGASGGAGSRGGGSMSGTDSVALPASTSRGMDFLIRCWPRWTDGGHGHDEVGVDFRSC